jgi:KDO2-lipid IV(A) lauroyltransferase
MLQRLWLKDLDPGKDPDNKDPDNTQKDSEKRTP